jgi:hypothetical protein
VWKPVSKREYLPLNPKAQILVVTCPMLKRDMSRWNEKAVAAVGDSGRYLRDVVRDLLANPQVRAIVFDGPACGRAAYDAFWAGEAKPEWRIEDEHLTLVRRFVDLYDDDCGFKVQYQPYWPARIMYSEEQPCV